MKTRQERNIPPQTQTPTLASALGVGGPGSNPGWLLVALTFVVLVTLRLVSLVLGAKKPEATEAEKRKVIPMIHVKSTLPIMAETTWVLGTSMLAGLPLLT